MSDQLFNIIRREVQRCIGQLAGSKTAIVDSYDPARHAARVFVLPEMDPALNSGLPADDQKVSGWLPIAVQWMGNGWGEVSPVGKGDQVAVVFTDMDRNSGIIVGRLFDQRNPPPQGAPYGERWFVHKTGAFIKLKNDGSIQAAAPNGMAVNVSGSSTGLMVTGSGGAVLGGNLVQAINDAAAQAAGVPLNGFYHNGNGVQIRLT